MGSKLPVAAMLAALVLAGAAAYLYRGAIVPPGAEDARAARRSFERTLRDTVQPIAEVGLLDVPQGEVAAELVDPRAALPSSHLVPYETIAALYAYADRCDGSAAAGTAGTAERTAGLDKAWTWHEHLCGARAELPPGFFEHPPLIHPSGASYVYLAVRSGRPELASSAFLEAHLSRLHLLELANLPGAIDRLSAGGELLASLAPGELVDLVEGRSLVIGEHRVLLKEPAEGDAGARYAAFPRSAWDQALEGAPWSLVPASIGSEACALVEGRWCWTLDRERWARRSRWAAVLGASSVVILAIALGAVLARRIQGERRRHEERRLVLETLTHELRTPAAGLALALEPLREDFDRLPDGSQTAFLRMCDEVQRLRRVVEASARYLSADSGGAAAASRRLPSMNGYVQSVLDRFDAGDVELIRLPDSDDHPFVVDPFWLAVCIENLVDNALRHGKPPVRVRLVATRGSELTIAVEDAGDPPAVDRARVGEPFVKSASSKGLGLGLGVVKKAVESMGGRLSFTTHPTTFSITLRSTTKS